MTPAKPGVPQITLEEAIQVMRYDLDAQRLELDKKKSRLEVTFFAKHFPAILAALLTLAGVGVSVTNIMVGERSNRNSTDLATKKDFREFVATYRKELFGTDRVAAEQLRRMLEITFPKDFVSEALTQITRQAPPETRDIFSTLPKAGAVVRGKISTWGGPDDMGLMPNEGLALIRDADLPRFQEYFLPDQPQGAKAVGRQLNPDKFYISARWDYSRFPASYLRDHKVTVTNPRTGISVEAQPVDWGPGEWSGRVADLSPGLARHLGLKTDDEVIVTIPEAKP